MTYEERRELHDLAWKIHKEIPGHKPYSEELVDALLTLGDAPWGELTGNVLSACVAGQIIASKAAGLEPDLTNVKLTVAMAVLGHINEVTSAVTTCLSRGWLVLDPDDKNLGLDSLTVSDVGLEEAKKEPGTAATRLLRSYLETVEEAKAKKG